MNHQQKGPLTGRTGKVLREHHLKPKKSLGQNFLTDARVLEKMVAAANVDVNTGVLEVGPGLGALTEQLAQRAGAVVAIEIDQRLIPVLRQEFTGMDHVHIEWGDILTLDVKKLMMQYFKGSERVVVVANLPYYITSPVMMRLLELTFPFDCLVLMIQKEMAERLLASPGHKDYGLLTIAVKYYAAAEMITRVPAHVFIPRPKVDSAVIRLTPHPVPPVRVESEEQFFRIVRAGFKERRKTLANNFKSHLFPDWDKTRINEWLNQFHIDPSRRAETLSLEEFARISNAL